MPQNPPDTLPPDFFSKQVAPPDTLPADFFTHPGEQVRDRPPANLPPDLPQRVTRFAINSLPIVGGMVGAALAPEGVLPAVGAAMLGGAGGSTAKQALNYAADEPGAPRTWKEAAGNVAEDTAIQGATELGGQAASGLLGMAARKLAPSKLYQSAIKPPPGMGRQSAETAVQAGLEYGVPASEAGAAGNAAAIRDLNAKVNAEIANNPQTPIDPQVLRTKLDELRAKWQHSPDYQRAIDDFEQEFIPSNPISTANAQEMKKEFYKRALMENKQAFRQGTIPGIDTQARQYVAQQLMQELESRYPALHGLNAEEGARIELRKALDRFIGREGNKNVIGLIPAILGTGAGVMAGHGPEGAAAGGLASLAVLALDNPLIKSKLAIALTRAAKTPIGQAAARVATSKAVNIPNAVRGVEEFTAYAKGGVIRKPHLLVDATTGQADGIMAERGPERIEPLASPASPESAALRTVPESKATMRSQMQQLIAGKRRVVMFPKGTPRLKRPAKMQTYQDEHGNYFIFNPARTSTKAIDTAVRENTLPRLLGSTKGGMGAPDKSMLSENSVVVAGRNRDGVTTQATATDAAHFPQTISQTSKVTPAGGDMDVESPEDELNRRIAARRKENKA